MEMNEMMIGKMKCMVDSVVSNVYKVIDRVFEVVWFVVENVVVSVYYVLDKVVGVVNQVVEIINVKGKQFKEVQLWFVDNCCG